jgi:hypothetical protein
MVQRAVRNGCTLAMTKLTDLPKHIDKKLMVFHIIRRGATMIRMVNIYSQRARKTGKQSARRLR